MIDKKTWKKVSTTSTSSNIATSERVNYVIDKIWSPQPQDEGFNIYSLWTAIKEKVFPSFTIELQNFTEAKDRITSSWTDATNTYTWENTNSTYANIVNKSRDVLWQASNLWFSAINKVWDLIMYPFTQWDTQTYYPSDWWLYDPQNYQKKPWIVWSIFSWIDTWVTWISKWISGWLDYATWITPWKEQKQSEIENIKNATYNAPLAFAKPLLKWAWKVWWAVKWTVMNSVSETKLWKMLWWDMDTLLKQSDEFIKRSDVWETFSKISQEELDLKKWYLQDLETKVKSWMATSDDIAELTKKIGLSSELTNKWYSSLSKEKSIENSFIRMSNRTTELLHSIMKKSKFDEISKFIKDNNTSLAVQKYWKQVIDRFNAQWTRLWELNTVWQFKWIFDVNFWKKVSQGEDLWSMFKDTLSNSPKADKIDNLLAEWYITEVKQTDNLFSYKLTEAGIPFFKTMVYDTAKDIINSKTWKKFTEKELSDYVDKRVQFALKEWFAHHSVDFMNKYRAIKQSPMFTMLWDSAVWEMNDVSMNMSKAIINGDKTMATSYADTFSKSLEVINNKFNLWIWNEITKLKAMKDIWERVKFAETLTDMVNKKAKQWFINADKIKVTDVYKLVSFSKSMYRNIGKNLEKIKYTEKIKWLKKEFDEAIAKVKKDDYEKYRIELITLRNNFFDKKLKFETEAMMLSEARQTIVKHFTDLSKQWAIRWDMDEIIRKFVSTKQWEWIKTEKQLKAQIEKVTKAVWEMHIWASHKEIWKRLKKYNDLKMSDTKYNRSKIEWEYYTKILTLKEFYDVNKSNLSIDAIDTLLIELDTLDEMGRNISKTINSRVVSKIQETVAKWEKELNSNIYKSSSDSVFDTSVIDKINNKYIQWWKNALEYKDRTIERIFGRDWVMYDLLVTKPHSAEIQIDLYNKNTLTPAIKLISRLIKPSKMEEFGIFKFMQQSVIHNWKVKYLWFERIINDVRIINSWRLKKWSWVTTMESIPFLTNEDWWKLRDTKIWEIIENWIKDITFEKASQIADKISDDLFNKLEDVVFRNEWVRINKRAWYFSMKETYKKWTDIDFNPDDNWINATISNWFIKEVTENVKDAWFWYEYDFMKVFLNSNQKQLYYIYMKDTFENAQSILRWKVMNMTWLKDNEIRDLMSSWRVNIEDLEWNIINPEYKVIDWIDRLVWEDWTILDTTQLQLVYKKWWLYWSEKMTNWAREFLKEYMKQVSWAWKYSVALSDRIVAKAIANANIVPLMGNINTVAVQSSSLFDILWQVWYKSFWKAFRDVILRKDILTKLEEIPSIKLRDWWDPLLSARYNFKWSTWAWYYLANIFEWYKELTLKPMKIVDKFAYRIWYLANLEIEAKKAWLLKQWDDVINIISTDNINILSRTDDRMRRTMNSPSRLFKPQVYEWAMWQVFFWLASTQLQRVQEFFQQSRYLWSDWDKIWAFRLTTHYILANIYEQSIRIAVSKTLSELWFAKDYNADKDFNETFFVWNTAYNTTIWQFFWMNKVGAISNWFSPSPFLWLMNDTSKALKKAYDEVSKDWVNSADEATAIILDQMAKITLGKPYSYIKTKVWE